MPEPHFSPKDKRSPHQYFSSGVKTQQMTTASPPVDLFQLDGVLPDLLYIKRIDSTAHHLIFDTLRAESKDMANALELSSTASEAQQGTTVLSAENRTITGDVVVMRNAYNTNIVAQSPTTSRTIVHGWSMVQHDIPDATGSYGNATTTLGSGGGGIDFSNKIGNNSAPTPTVPSSQTSGMNAEQYLNSDAQQMMIKYTGVAGQAEVDHGLDGAPEFFMVKKYSASGTNWKFWHKSLGLQGIGEMNTQTGTLTNDTTHWSSSGQNYLDSAGGALRRIRFVGNNTSVNATGASHILYAWRGVDGYSKFGSYTPDQGEYPFIWCGFRPRLIWIKRADGFASRWQVISHTGLSGQGELTEMRLEINNAAAIEDSQNINNQDFTHGHFVYIYNEGFKINAGNSFVRATGVKYIYCAWGDETRKYANYFTGSHYT